MSNKSDLAGKNRSLIGSAPLLKNIYFYLTGDCNLACRHCWISPDFQSTDQSEKALSFSIFKKIIQEAKELGLTSVKLSGGEPFIHPDIASILGLIAEEDLFVTIETNGIALTPELVNAIKSCSRHYVSVSLDGSRESHEWMRGVAGSYDRAVSGVKMLVNAGIHPQIIMSVSSLNKEEIADLASYAKTLGANSVKYNFINPVARGETMGKKDQIIPVYEQIFLSRWIQEDLSKSLGIRLVTSLPIVFRSLTSIFSNKGSCGSCKILSTIGVLYDGTYALCGIGSTVSELCFGNAGKDTLSDIWNYSPLLHEIRTNIPNHLKGICSKCMVRDRCKGYCIAHNYYLCHDLFAGQIFCEKAHEENLFPVNRLIDRQDA